VMSRADRSTRFWGETCRTGASLIGGHKRETHLRYRGTLELDATRRGGGLAVELALIGRKLTVSSDEGVLGSYPIDEVEITRLGSDRFDLRVGSEQLVFTAEDAIRFSYEALPMIESYRSHRTQRAIGKVRSWLKENEADPGEQTESDAEPVTPVGLAFTPNAGLLSERRQVTAEDREGERVAEETVESQVVVSPSEQTSAAVSEAVRSVTSARTRVAATGGLNDVVSRLEQAVTDVYEGRLDPERGQAMASLAMAMVETAELAKSEEARNSRD
jgi:hypothetical protein